MLLSCLLLLYPPELYLLSIRSRRIKMTQAIHFAYELTPPDAELGPPAIMAELNGWRALLRRLGVIAQEADRYEGYGFGSVSFRDPENPEQFYISASQTGGLPSLDDEQMVLVTRCNPARSWVDATGYQPPSSETLIHGMLYQADPRLHWVVHGHCAELWQHYKELNLLCTAPGVADASAAMGDAAVELLQLNQSRPFAFVTLGQEDGVFACGATIRDVSNLLVNLLARALVSQQAAGQALS